MLHDISSRVALLLVEGEDSAKFLQGQLTNDINLLNTEQFIYAAYLNVKGRVLANFIICKIDVNKYILLTDISLIESVSSKLKMFILRSKVSIKQLDATIFLTSTLVENNINIQLSPNLYLNYTQDIIQNKTNAANEFDSFLVQHGVAFINKSLEDTFIPQHLNLDLLNAVNFKKGCYVGQEIVARTHYLGKVKRRMFKFSSTIPTSIGQNLYSPLHANQSVGQIVNLAKIDNNLNSGLISVIDEYKNEVFLDEDCTQKINVIEIGY
jgi:folate-binding protein YgfZ